MFFNLDAIKKTTPIIEAHEFVESILTLSVLNETLISKCHLDFFENAVVYFFFLLKALLNNSQMTINIVKIPLIKAILGCKM